MEKILKIHDVINETPDSITAVFENDKHLENYQSGQYINVSQKIGNEIISRPYSFSSSPIFDKLPSITIKKVPGGKLSTYLVDNLKKGQELEVSIPFGRFGFGQTEIEEKNLVFIAGGSGITPIISLIKTALKTSNNKITLLYGNRNERSIILKNELLELQNKFKSRLNIKFFLDEIVDRNSTNAIEGNISREFLESFLNQEKLIDGYYICGPEGMMNSILYNLESFGVPSQSIHTESFGSSLKQKESSSKEISKVTITNSKETFELEIPKGQFILESALHKGFLLPHSCKEAMCGTCVARIITGKVTMQENYALTDAQISEGYTLLCSGLPVSDEIILTYL